MPSVQLFKADSKGLNQSGGEQHCPQYPRVLGASGQTHSHLRSFCLVACTPELVSLLVPNGGWSFCLWGLLGGACAWLRGSSDVWAPSSHPFAFLPRILRNFSHNSRQSCLLVHVA